jgi:ATP/ADP translocase
MYGYRVNNEDMVMVIVLAFSLFMMLFAVILFDNDRFKIWLFNIGEWCKDFERRFNKHYKGK